MQYDLELTINLPRKRVIELFDSVENFFIEQDDNTIFGVRATLLSAKPLCLRS